MIALTPNLRLIKPLSRYMELRIRMYGRQRIARSFESNRSNQSSVVLPFTPYSPANVEIYLDGVRMVGGYTIAGNTVTFVPTVSGKLTFTEDDDFPNMNDKWLVVPTPALLHSEDTKESGYGTDRRIGPLVATKAKPICITQGVLGFCRPSADGDQLLYCPYYGIYGRDSITYAIKSDLGQLSDYRCIDIRVRDPSYIPTVRLCALSMDASPVKADGEVFDITPDGFWQIYGEIRTGATIQLPNIVDEAMREFHFVIQGQDENGDWFELSEYFDPEDYNLNVVGAIGTTVTYVGPADAYGHANAVLISLMCDMKGSQATVNLTINGNQSLFTGRIYSNAITSLSALKPVIANEKVTLNPGVAAPDQVLSWAYNPSWISDTGINLGTTWTNSYNETRPAPAVIEADVTLPVLYDPVTKANKTFVIDVNGTYTGSFTTDADEANNVVVMPENKTVSVGDDKYYWLDSDPFSVVYSGVKDFPVTFDWDIHPYVPPVPPENP
ncbi:hypothetical protein D3C80_283380 [compost metagenome]